MELEGNGKLTMELLDILLNLLVGGKCGIGCCGSICFAEVDEET